MREILTLEGRPNDKLVVRTASDIDTAAATAFAGVKSVLYNPDAFVRLRRLAETDWVVVYLVAHEVIHHLLGHTTSAIPSSENYGVAELEVNERAGFILKQLGAPLADALRATASACAFVNASPADTKATVDAVERGWRRVT